MTASHLGPQEFEERRMPASQEEQLRMLILAGWTEFAAELDLADIRRGQEISHDWISYGSSRGGSLQDRVAHCRRFSFVEQHASAFEVLGEQIRAVERGRCTRRDLREALWTLHVLRRALPLWEARFPTHAAMQQLRAFEPQRRDIGR